jgi:hypothetical protein
MNIILKKTVLSVIDELFLFIKQLLFVGIPLNVKLFVLRYVICTLKQLINFPKKNGKILLIRQFKHEAFITLISV